MAISSEVERNRYSIAEARDRLPRLVHEVESGAPVELTRHGKPVAVLLSRGEYDRLTGAAPEREDFWSAYERFRAKVNLERDGLEGHEFDDVHDKSPGRDFEW